MPKTFIDLFAGIGGFHWALKELDYKCLLAVEKDEAAQEVYKRNFKEIRRKGQPTLNKCIGDIRSLTRIDPEDERTEIKPEKIAARFKAEFKINEGDVGVICGGFPCQPFSKSGAQLGDKDATRGTLFHDILLLTEALRPEYLILENVRNLAGQNHKHTLDVIVSRISKLEYEIEKKPITLSPHQLPDDKGSPQVRDRVFILARRKGLKTGRPPAEVSRHIEFIKNTSNPNWDASSILGSRASKKYKISKAEKSWIRIWEKFLKITQDIKLPGHPIWTDVFVKKLVLKEEMPEWEKSFINGNNALYSDIIKAPKRRMALREWLSKIQEEKTGPDGKSIPVIPASRRKFEWQANRAFKDGEKRTLKKLLIQFRPSGIRVKPPTHYPALVAMTQTTVVGPLAGSKKPREYYRYITPKEAAKLQGMFKIKFGRQVDALSYKQLGNAVNVKVIKYLAERLMDEAPNGKPLPGCP